MRSSHVARHSYRSTRILSFFCAAILCCGLIPSTAFAINENSLSLIPEGEQGTVLIGHDAEEGSTDAFSHSASDEATSVDGGGAAASSENASDKGPSVRIDRDVSLASVAQRESAKAFFLARTLESTKSVPVVSADLPLDAVDGGRANGLFDDPKGTANGIASDSIVIGSFDRCGITYAIEPGGASVAMVAWDRSKLSSDLVDAKTIMIPSDVPVEGSESYPVTRIAADAFGRTVVDPAVQEEDATAPEISIGAMSSETGVHGSDAASEYLGDAANGDDEDIDEAVEGPDVAPDITAIVVPPSVVKIEDGAFTGFSALQRVDVSPDNLVYSAHDGCLYDGSANTLLFIPEGYEGTVRVPSTVTDISPDVFSHSPAVSSIVVHVDNPDFASADGLLYDKDKAVLVRAPIARASVEIDAACSSIGSRAFLGCADLVRIAHAGAIESIAHDAFGNASFDNADPASDASENGDMDAVVERADAGPIDLHDAAIDPLESGSPDYRHRGIDLCPPNVTVALANDGEPLRDPWKRAGFTRFEVIQSQIAEAESEESIEASAMLASGDVREEQGAWNEGLIEVAEGEVGSASVLAGTVQESVSYDAGHQGVGRESVTDTVNGFAYNDPVQLWIASSTSTEAPGIFGAFVGAVSWTTGDASGPSKGAIVTVNVDKFTPWGDNTLTSELLAAKFSGSNYTGTSGKAQRLDGFSTDTGSYVSLDTLFSGKPFSFSYTMGTVVAPKKTSDASESGAEVSSYAGCFVDKLYGVHWNSVGQALDPSPFVPRYTELSDHVGVRFHPNGGSWASLLSDITSTTTPQSPPGTQRNCVALVFSEKTKANDSVLVSPRTPLAYAGKVFKGWYASTASNAQRIRTLEEAIANGYTVYAQWEDQKGSFAYDEPVQMRIALNTSPYAAAFFGAFTGDVSWTVGSAAGPAKSAVVTVDIEKFTPWGDNTLTDEMLAAKYRGSNYTGAGGKAQRLDGFMTDVGSYISLEALYSGQPFTFSFTMGTVVAPMESPDGALDGAAEPTYNGCFVDETKGVCFQGGGSRPIDTPPFVARYADLLDHVGVNFHPANGSWKSPVSDLTSTTSPHAPIGYQRNCSALVFTQRTGANTPLKTPQTPLIYEGKVFRGWYTAPEGGSKVVTVEEAIANDYNVYAHWASASGSFSYAEPAQVRIATGSDSISMLFMGEFTGEVSWDKGGADGPAKDAVVAVDIESFSPFGDNVLTEELLAEKFKSGDWKGASGSAQRPDGFATDCGSYISFETLFSGDKFSFSYTMGTVVAPVDLMFDGALLPSFVGCFVDKERGVVWQTGSGTSPEGELVSAKVDASPFTVRHRSVAGEYGVRFHPNGGSWKSPINGNLSRKPPHAPNAPRDVLALAFSEKTLASDNSLISPTTPLVNGDKVFLGWFTKAEGGSRTTTVEQAQANGNVVYAHWGEAVKTRYGVIYDGNGATGGSTSSSYDYVGVPIKIAKNGFERIGHRFVGWKDDAGASYAEGSMFAPSLAAGERLYLHAQWEPNLYLVSLSAADATSAGHTGYYYQKYGMGAYADSEGDVPLPTIIRPERKGWRFNGYWTEEHGQGECLIDADGNTPESCDSFSDDTGVLYAWWIKNLDVTVPVTFDHIALETVLDVDTNSLSTTTDAFTFENRSDGAIRIVSVEEDQGSDVRSRAEHDARLDTALAFFGGPESDAYQMRLDRLSKVHITMKPSVASDSETVCVSVDGTGSYVFPASEAYPASWVLAPGSALAPKGFPIELSLRFDPDYRPEHLGLNSQSETIAKLIWTVDLL